MLTDFAVRISSLLHIIRGTPGGQFTVIVEIEGLQKIYNGRQRVVAVDGIDLSVREGELFGLLGPNGAGKTTTISICTTRALPTAGRVRIAGIDVVKAPSLARRSIGVVPQFNTLDRACTIFENIHFHCRYFGLSRAALGRPCPARSDRPRHCTSSQGSLSRRAERGTRSAEPYCDVGGRARPAGGRHHRRADNALYGGSRRT